MVTPSKTNTEDIRPQEQAKQSPPSGEPKSIAHSEKRVTEVQAACFTLKTYWNHKMTTVNRYLPFNLALYLFPKGLASGSSLLQKYAKKPILIDGIITALSNLAVVSQRHFPE